jgi:ribosomal protein S18 acetylase RimI-like enzyme
VLPVLELWRLAASTPSPTDRAAVLASLLEHDPRALLLAEADGGPIGTLIVAWNGWRGSFYRLAVAPSRRRQGVATLLVREGERRLRARGAMRIDAIVDSDDRAAMATWSALGYARQSDRARFVRDFKEP